jgi:hypothetical protein
LNRAEFADLARRLLGSFKDGVVPALVGRGSLKTWINLQI